MLVAEWLEQFDVALQGANQASLASLFASDGHWRDLLAFTWSITPRQGAESIAALMVSSQPATRAHGFAIAEGRTPPRCVQRAGVDVIEAIFQFETGVGRGFGVLRLLASEPAKAFQLMTSLHELKGYEEAIGNRCPTGEAFSRNFGGTNWKEQREAIQAYTDREPTVLIVGGGQAGLSLAATLGRIGVDTLVVDKFPRIGDCWRRRYHSLALHNDTKLNHLPTCRSRRRGRPIYPRTCWPTGSKPTHGQWKSISGPAPNSCAGSTTMPRVSGTRRFTTPMALNARCIRDTWCSPTAWWVPQIFRSCPG